MNGFNEGSHNSLLARIVKLEERCEYLEAALAAMQEAFNSLSSDRAQLSGGLFSKKDEVEVVTVQVARDGSRVMYIPDKTDPNIHHDVPCDRFVGQFKKIELQEGTFKNKPITYVLAHMKNGNQLVRLRLGNVGNPSGALKSFLDNLSRISDEELCRNVIFWPYPGNDDSVTLVSLLNPETEKSFPYPVDRQKADWNDDVYWQDLLMKSIARIEAVNNSTLQTTSQASTQAPPEPKTPPPAQKTSVPQSVGDRLEVIGSLKDIGLLKQYPDDEDARITRSVLPLTVHSDGRDISCLIYDGVAVKTSQLYRVGTKVRCEGARDRVDGVQVLVVDILEAWGEPESAIEFEDLSSLIAESDILMERCGMTKEHGKEFLKRTYKKGSRQKLSPDELRDFVEYLKAQPAVGVFA